MVYALGMAPANEPIEVREISRKRKTHSGASVQTRTTQGLLGKSSSCRTQTTTTIL